MTTKLSENTEQIIKSRYSWRDENGVPYEDWTAISNRIAYHVAKAERTDELRNEWGGKFFNIINDRIFIPNTPCIVNAGKPKGQAMLAACFVLPIEDTLESILETAKNAGLIHRSGGGTGFSFERLRPAGAKLSAGGTASGPVSFMNIFNTITETIKQGGVRRGANMGVMRVDHPNILDFIHMKNDQTTLTNFNISVSVTDEFMEAVKNKEWYSTKFDGQNWGKDIIDPLTNEVYKTVNSQGDWIVNHPGRLYAPDVWNRIIKSAHGYAEPGVIFIDTVNRSNFLKNTLGDILSSNPCAEQMLHGYNSCNLGSIDLSKLVSDAGNFMFTKFSDAIYTAVRFLDDVIDVCDWPLPQIEETVKRTRPIGLGVMGFADALIKMKIRYGSKESLEFVHTVGRWLKNAAWKASWSLGMHKGVFPDFERNKELYFQFFAGLHNFPTTVTPRNYQVTTIAPTGTISLIAETSSGIEPNFEWEYTRRDSIGERHYVHPLVLKYKAKRKTFDPELPEYFVTAHNLTAEDHVRMLAAWQPYIDNSISKTCNGASTDTVEDVDKLYRLAHSLGVKAVSYYRDGSREGQVLSKISDNQLAITSDNESDSKGGDPVSQPDGAVSKVQLRTEDIDTIMSEEVPHEYIEEYTSKDQARHRPNLLMGQTWKFKLGEQEPLYITVNHDGLDILEVFAVGPISSSVGLLISKMLRNGFTTEEVIGILRKKSGPYTVWFNQKCHTTPEQLIAECLSITVTCLDEGWSRVGLAVMGEMNELAKSFSTSPEVVPGVVYGFTNKGPFKVSLCPDCKGQLQRKEGCVLCTACGYSKCA